MNDVCFLTDAQLKAAMGRFGLKVGTRAYNVKTLQVIYEQLDKKDQPKIKRNSDDAKKSMKTVACVNDQKSVNKIRSASPAVSSADVLPKVREVKHCKPKNIDQNIQNEEIKLSAVKRKDATKILDAEMKYSFILAFIRSQPALFERILLAEMIAFDEICAIVQSGLDDCCHITKKELVAFLNDQSVSFSQAWR